MKAMPSRCGSSNPSRNSAALTQETSSGRSKRERLARNHRMAGPGRPDSISRSRSIRNDASSNTGGMAALSFGTLRQFRFGPIGQLVGGHNLPQGTGVDQLRAGHFDRLGRAIQLAQLVRSVTGGNGKFFHEAKLMRS